MQRNTTSKIETETIAPEAAVPELYRSLRVLRDDLRSARISLARARETLDEIQIRIRKDLS